MLSYIMNKLIMNIFISIIFLLLISCGLKGPLYLSKDEINSGNKRDIITIIDKKTESNLQESIIKN